MQYIEPTKVLISAVAAGLAANIAMGMTGCGGKKADAGFPIGLGAGAATFTSTIVGIESLIGAAAEVPKALNDAAAAAAAALKAELAKQALKFAAMLKNMGLSVVGDFLEKATKMFVEGTAGLEQYVGYLLAIYLALRYIRR